MVNTIVTIVGSDQFSRPKLRNLQAFIGFCLLILVKNLVAPAFESEIQKDEFPYALRRKYAHNPEHGFLADRLPHRFTEEFTSDIA